MRSKAIQISAVIITYNEEANIARCLDSLAGVADEIIVVDCFSRDNTKRICLSKGVSFHEHEFLGFAHQKNYAVSLARFDYVLSLDADEYLSSTLASSILKIKSNCSADGYTMNRLSSYAGEWIKTCGWYPDTKLRLWKKSSGYWKGGGIHEWVELCEGRVVHLNGDLLHHAYDNITQFLEKIQRYSDIYAVEHRFKVHSSAFKVFYKTFYSFFKSFFLKRGILDGYKGLLISVCNANFVFYKYSKLLEANRQLETSLIVSTYNRKDALELTLLSILNQSVMPNEVIIADDGSDADTRQLINSYREKFPVPLIHCWHQDDSFQSGQIKNKAIAIASYEYIIHVDGDMVLHRHFIKSHRNVVQKGRFIVGEHVKLSPEKTVDVLLKKRVNARWLHTGLKNKITALTSPVLSWFLSGPNTTLDNGASANIAFWKEDFLHINGFNEDVIGWGKDVEMTMRLAKSGVSPFSLKFAGYGFHLHHPEGSRTESGELDGQFQMLFHNQVTRCKNGIDKYLLKSKKQQAA